MSDVWFTNIKAFFLVCSQHEDLSKMKKQKNTFQMKQDKTSEKDLNEAERNYLPKKEFKVRVTEMLTKLRRGMDE